MRRSVPCFGVSPPPLRPANLWNHRVSKEIPRNIRMSKGLEVKILITKDLRRFHDYCVYRLAPDQSSACFFERKVRCHKSRDLCGFPALAAAREAARSLPPTGAEKKKGRQ